MRRRLACGFAACAAIILAAGRPARADLVYALSPTAGAGAADNVIVVPETGDQQHVRDGFTLVGGSMRLAYTGQRSTHALGYTLTYSRYVQDLMPATLSNALSWLSTFNLSALWTLRLGASAALTRSSGLDANPATVDPQSAVAGSALFGFGVATQQLQYEPNASWGYSEQLTVGHLRYLDSTIDGMPVTLPRTTTATLALMGKREMGREEYSVVVDVTDSYTQIDGPAGDAFSTGHTLFGRALAGWKHDLSAAWSTLLQAGPSVIYRLEGSGVLAPAAVAAVHYSQVPWFASLVATQTPMANLYLGDAILADQVIARLAVPLTRSERLFVGAFGGYSYARVADADGHFQRAYDQFLAGASLNLRFSPLPISASAAYTVTSQRGSALAGHAVPDLGRQYVFVSIRGDLAWGPGTPPLFGGP